MRVAWLTDIHLNFLTEAQIRLFGEEVGATGADVVLVSGDIAEAPSLVQTLEILAAGRGRILFVLGNHDFYKGRIEDVRDVCRSLDFAVYLHGAPPVALTDDVGIVGVDGWGDGLFGCPRESELIFTDWHLIGDFRDVDAVFDVDRRLELLERQGAESAVALRRSLEQAVQRFSKVVVLTHVPPFASVAGDDGTHRASLWVPWLACKATGEVITEFAAAYPNTQFEVLCGHTHVRRTSREAHNLWVEVGAAEYRKPQIQRVWDQMSKS